MSRGTGNAEVTIIGMARNDTDDRSSGGTDDSIAQASRAYTANTIHLDDVSAAFNGLTLNANELMTLRYRRVGSDGDDTIGAELQIYGFQIVYA